MTTVPSPKPINLWQSRMGERADEYAALFATAARYVRTCGYDAYQETGVKISVNTALHSAARDRAALEIDKSAMTSEQYQRALEVGARDWQEELRQRFAACLYVVGQQLYNHDRDLGQAVDYWEMGYSSDAPRPDEDKAVAMLEAASHIYAVLAGNEATNGR